MGNDSNDSNDILKKKFEDWLKKEFEKEQNILDKFNNNEIIRVERKIKNKKCYYFNISGFFDPDRGFLKVLIDLYERYNEVKAKAKDIMPFTCLIFQPYEKIIEILGVKKGGHIDSCMTILYSFGIGIGINAILAFISSVNIPLGIAVTSLYYINSIYEIYKGLEQIKKIKKLKSQGDLFISKILKIFGDKFRNNLTSDNNVVEIIIDEKYDNLLLGLVHGLLCQEEGNVEINFMSIKGLKNAKTFKELPEMDQIIYSDIIEAIKKCKNDQGFIADFEKLSDKYRETFQKSNKNYMEKKKLERENIELEKEKEELKSERDELKSENEELKSLLKSERDELKSEKEQYKNELIELTKKLKSGKYNEGEILKMINDLNEKIKSI